jgi:protein-S-isoprenylcysteine O-methyltransferase Ste14
VKLIVAGAVYLALTVALPVLRSFRRTGSTGVVRLDGKQLLTVLGLIVCAVGAVTPQAWTSPSWIYVTGWTCMVAGTAVTCAAQAQMGKSWRFGIATGTALVTTGLYRWVRNPIYAGVQLTMVGVVAVSPALWGAAMVAGVILLFGMQARAEERHLRATHGAEYVAWASRVGRFVPGVGKLALLNSNE